jgi:hypothetical protein
MVYCGNLKVSGGMLEAVSGSSDTCTVPAVLVDTISEGQGGEILLEDAAVTGGGAIVPVIYRGVYADTQESYEESSGQSISGEAQVVWTQEQAYVGASGHVILGQ